MPLHALVLFVCSLFGGVPSGESVGDLITLLRSVPGVLRPHPDPVGERGPGPRSPVEMIEQQLLTGTQRAMISDADADLLRRAAGRVPPGTHPFEDQDFVKTVLAEADSAYSREVMADLLRREAVASEDWESALKYADVVERNLEGTRGVRAPGVIERAKNHLTLSRVSALRNLGREDEALKVLSGMRGPGVGGVTDMATRQTLFTRAGLLAALRGTEEAQQAVLSASPPEDDPVALGTYVNDALLFGMNLRWRHGDDAAAAFYTALVKRHGAKIEPRQLNSVAVELRIAGKTALSRTMREGLMELHPDYVMNGHIRSALYTEALFAEDWEAVVRYSDMMLEEDLSGPDADPERVAGIKRTRDLAVMYAAEEGDLKPIPEPGPLPAGGK